MEHTAELIYVSSKTNKINRDNVFGTVYVRQDSKLWPSVLQLQEAATAKDADTMHKVYGMDAWCIVVNADWSKIHSVQDLMTYMATDANDYDDDIYITSDNYFDVTESLMPADTLQHA